MLWEAGLQFVCRKFSLGGCYRPPRPLLASPRSVVSPYLARISPEPLASLRLVILFHQPSLLPRKLSPYGVHGGCAVKWKRCRAVVHPFSSLVSLELLSRMSGALIQSFSRFFVIRKILALAPARNTYHSRTQLGPYFHVPVVLISHLQRFFPSYFPHCTGTGNRLLFRVSFTIFTALRERPLIYKRRLTCGC